MKYLECEKLNRVFKLDNGRVYSTQLWLTEWWMNYGFVHVKRLPYKGVNRWWHDESDGVTHYYGRKLFNI